MGTRVFRYREGASTRLISHSHIAAAFPETQLPSLLFLNGKGELNPYKNNRPGSCNRAAAAFAKEACALRKEHGWTIDHVERVAKEFLRRLTIEVVFEKFPGLDRHWISNWDGSIAADVERRFKASGEWVQYEELLLAESAPKPVQAKGAIPETVAGSFTHSPDYSSVTFRGKTFSLTSRQAQFIEILHEAHRNETPDVSMHFILEKLGTQNSRWQDTWKSNPRAKRALVKPGTRKGKLRLNL